MLLNFNPPQETQFPESKWKTLQDKMESGGPLEVCTFIESFDAPTAVSDLYDFSQRAYMKRQWAGKSLDLYVEVVRSGIAWQLARAKKAEEQERPLTRREHLERAFQLSCRMAYDLCDCWTGDTMPRESRHYKLGLAAAKDCLRWLNGQGVAPRDLADVWWIRGIHELALGLAADARHSLEKSKEETRRALRIVRTPPRRDARWWMILLEACIALAEHKEGSIDAWTKCQELYNSLKAGPGNDNTWTEEEAQRSYATLGCMMLRDEAENGKPKNENGKRKMENNQG